MTHADVKSLNEFLGRVDAREMARENRALRARLGEMIDLADGWYYGPLFETRGAFGHEEPVELRRAKATLAGDFRKVSWIKASVRQAVSIRSRLRKTKSRVVHMVLGVWILFAAILAAKLGHGTGWWAPEDTLDVMLGAFGGWAAGGMSMWERLYSRRLGISV
jgi:hypothetical protein